MKPGEDFTVNQDGTLDFRSGIVSQPVAVRYLDDARGFLLADLKEANRPLYYMYRGVAREEDREVWAHHGIRYDLTVLLPELLGREYNKTVGHFHPLRPQGGGTYPEYYEVLQGEALYLLQKNTGDGEAQEVLAVEARKHDKVYIPPDYGHVTINPQDTVLVMANLVEATFASNYELYQKYRGAAYYYARAESGKGEFTKNPNYKKTGPLKLVAAPSLAQPTEAVKGLGLYEAFLAQPEAFSFLR